MFFQATADEDGVSWSTFDWSCYLANFGSNRASRRALRMVGAAISIFAGGFERAGERGSAYTIILEKDVRVS